ncbi:hypothetical protein [Paraburkholderia sp. ZP32-5]|uniref:hypothetical protein n=1 Tax=Paraburkholderia sp. ZP32-5 TaxID=2883245 RepID=UPI001F4294BE|nr:hypothetical protein [Paraburkholderia sp. ZP32-5]
MKRTAIRILIVVIFIAIPVMSGWQLTSVIEMLPFNMPAPVEMLIRLCLSVTGNGDLENPDDMEVFALLFYWILSALLISVLLCASARRLHPLHIRKNSQI